jgi:ribonuclease D
VQRGERRRHDPGVGARLEALKDWRRKKAAALHLDPGVLCPLSSLQAVARANPRSTGDLEAMEEVSRWRTREFGEEWIRTLSQAPSPGR